MRGDLLVLVRGVNRACARVIGEPTATLFPVETGDMVCSGEKEPETLLGCLPGVGGPGRW